MSKQDASAPLNIVQITNDLKDSMSEALAQVDQDADIDTLQGFLSNELFNAMTQPMLQLVYSYIQQGWLSTLASQISITVKNALSSLKNSLDETPFDGLDIDQVGRYVEQAVQEAVQGNNTGITEKDLTKQVAEKAMNAIINGFNTAVISNTGVSGTPRGCNTQNDIAPQGESSKPGDELQGGNVTTANLQADFLAQTVGIKRKQLPPAVGENPKAAKTPNPGKFLVAPLAIRPTPYRRIGKRCYVGKLARRITWQDLGEEFKDCGKVVYANVMEDRTGRSKGWGIVEFETPEEVVVHGLPWRYTSEDLKDKFSEIGQVDFAKVITNDQGRSKGFGTVRFTNPDDAAAAIDQLNGVYIEDRITVKYDKYAD